MKQVLIELDDETAERLERIAPARSRQRSGFIRAALARAISEVEEQRTRQAYLDHPDDGADAHFDPRMWEPTARYRRTGKRRK